MSHSQAKFRKTGLKIFKRATPTQLTQMSEANAALCIYGWGGWATCRALTSPSSVPPLETPLRFLTYRAPTRFPSVFPGLRVQNQNINYKCLWDNVG
jgi:hypothetical protein